MFGYCGKLLYVDLTSGEVETKPLEEETIRKYMGGCTLATRILFDNKAYEADPLGPDNTFVVMTGPLTGTLLPGASRFEIAARSPLSTGIGMSSCGGFFGAELKFAGFDGIVIKGESPEPVYLWINNGEAELRPAGGMWGKHTSETIKTVCEETGEKRARVMCVGPAGENGVLYANILTSGHNAAGRTGLGAVMGAKKLKAIAARGKKKVELFDKAAFMEIREKVLSLYKEDITTIAYNSYGTGGAMGLTSLVSDVPTRNWRKAIWPEGVEKLNGITMADTILVEKAACFACPIACKRVVTIPDGPYKMEKVPGPEYESEAAMGTLQMIDDLEAVTAANILCNELGMDSISAGSSVAFLTECYQSGLIGDNETGGIKLEWGNPELLMQLFRLASAREGIGELLSTGTKRMSEKIGKGSEKFAVHCKGTEAPMHDPRAFHGLALAYTTTPRGACHISHLTMPVEMGLFDYPEFGIKGPYDPLSKKGKADLVAAAEDLGMIVGSAVMCMFAMWPLSVKKHILPALNTATGMNWSLADLREMGARGWYLQRSFANLCGLGAKDDTLPERVTTPHIEGTPTGLDNIVAQVTRMKPPSIPGVKNIAISAIERILPVQKQFVMNLGRVMFTKKLTSDGLRKKGTPDIEYMLREYYTVRELDREGLPRAKKLNEMKLEDIAEALYGKGTASAAETTV
ncbi:MAG TPA: aldehyde ferredoxin oxidoreductase family protein [bacterium]|nr:aldehyde ferredoxin oxidoreductase family protein [bacterium]